MLDGFTAARPGVTDQETPLDYFVRIPIDHTHVHLRWVVRGRSPDKRLEVDIKFRYPNPRTNTRLLERFAKIRDELEAEIGQSLGFEDIQGRMGATRIRAKKVFGTMNDLGGLGLESWALNTMIAFHNAFKKRLDRMNP